jgi:AraC-like DNA-binding protein
MRHSEERVRRTRLGAHTLLLGPDRPHPASPSTIRLVARAKMYLADHVLSPVRLQHVAAAAGSSPAYLTTQCREIEGQPLHKYLLQRRLVRAIAELPHAADITPLAADLGVANHSRFTAAFRRAFGGTPSSFRGATRPARDRAVTTRPVRPEQRGWGTVHLTIPRTTRRLNLTSENTWTFITSRL